MESFESYNKNRYLAGRNIAGLAIMAMLVSALFSCEKEVAPELSDREGAYLVVEANIDDTSAEQWIRLSLSSSYYDVTEGAAVRSATVTVSKGDHYLIDLSINGQLFTLT